jgi:hypothetical protein
MPTPVTNDPKTTVNPAQSGPIDSNNPVQQTPEVKDNLTTNPGLVVDPNLNPTILAGEMTEEVPVLATPEDFKKKKKTVSQESINFFELILSQQKNSLEMKRDSLEARQRGAVAMQKAQKENAQDYDKKVNEQAESQRKSAAKSGFLSIFSKVFTAITAVIGAVMLFVPGMQAFGVLMLVGAAISIATQIPGVMEGLGKMFTALLTPFIGKEAAEKVGPIVATVFVAAVQITLAIAAPAAIVASALKVASAAMRAMASALRVTATAAGTIQGGVQGGVGIALGWNNIDLAKITLAVDSLQARSDFYDSQVQQLIEAINRNYNDMSADIRRMSQQIDSFPNLQIA